MSIEKKVDQIYKAVCAGQKKKIIPTQTWVKVGWIKQLTGWNKEQLRRARMEGLITMERRADGIYYCLESLNEKFIKNNSHATVS